jgi:hypothetical protein
MDNWCKPITSPKTGKRVSGGAARNVRIAAGEGMENIIAGACEYVLRQAETANRRKNLRAV